MFACLENGQQIVGKYAMKKQAVAMRFELAKSVASTLQHINSLRWQFSKICCNHSNLQYTVGYTVSYYDAIISYTLV